MTSPSSLPVYTQGYGTSFTGAPFVSNVDPTIQNIQGPNGPFKIGQVWVNSASNKYWALTSLSSSQGVVTATWEELTNAVSSGVTSVTGTTNQISASPTTGDVVLALTNGVSLGSYQAISPPPGGLIMPGILGVGTSTPTTNGGSTLSPLASSVYDVHLFGTMLALDGGANQFGLFSQLTFSPTSNAGSCCAYQSFATFALPGGVTAVQASTISVQTFLGSNAGTITTTIGIFVAPFSGSGGTLTNTYAGYFANPGVGVNRVALYTDDISCGVTANGTPTRGTIRSAPPASSAFSITFGTPVQNTLGYDVLISGYINVTAATAGSVQMGVASTSTPSTFPLTPALGAAQLISFSAYVPSNYYLSLAGSGVITVDSVLAIATPI
jgi:hypothetical protein